jgi:hypothetical protein
MSNPSAEAFIKGGDIVIRVPIEALPDAYRAAVDLNYIKSGFKVVDAKVFAKDVVSALNDEDEQGATPIHRMFDKAMEEAVEQGAEGVEESDEDEEE